MFRKLFTSIVAIPVDLGAFAQGHQSPVFSYEMFAFSWDVNVPVNNNFTDNTSWDGFQLEYRKMIQPDLSVGLELNWTGYDKYIPRQTYQLQHGAVTTDFYNYLYTIPMTVNAHHYFHVNNRLYPYVGLALGATYAEMKLYYNTYVSSDYNWGFLIRPEVGAIYKFFENDSWGVLLGVRYNYSTNTASSFKINGIQSIGFQLGIVAMK